MNHRQAIVIFSVALSGTAGVATAEPLPIEAFLKRPAFTDMKISPDGKHLAATVPLDDDKNVLVVLDRKSMDVTASMRMRGREQVDDFAWVSDSRLVVSAAQKSGMLDQPRPTGELFAINADGSQMKTLFGYRAGDSVGSRIGKPTSEYASAFLIDTVRDSDDEVIVLVRPWAQSRSSDVHSEARSMNVFTGATKQIARSPRPHAFMMSDRSANIRLSISATPGGDQQVHVRSAAGGDWRLLHDESVAGYAISPLAFDADGTHFLASREHVTGPGSVVRVEIEGGRQAQVLQPGTVDPGRVIFGAAHGHAVAVQFDDGKPDIAVLEADTRDARLALAVRRAFPDQFAYVTSYTRDGSLGLVHVYSDRNSGEFYLLHVADMKMHFLAASREWLDPQVMSEVRPVSLKARDGTPLHGLLTLPRGRDAMKLPLVVNPHGGPHGIRDYWDFNEEAQLLASRGYAVLQVNFRGSGGYGRGFERAGYRQWGGKMQDDIADAVRWTISEGFADADRICIYGASYGGYAALMNAARYPDLYQCTIGYVGVYDLNLMFNEGDIRESIYGRNYLARVLGNEQLAANSPVTYAGSIKMPVMLIHGSEDIRVPQTHADRMRSALREAGNDPVWLIERREGHGFYNLPNRVRLYTQLLAFLDEHIGSTSKPVAASE